MFHIFFGWSKASKCKRAMKRGRCRLKLLKNKREAIARQLRKDVAELVHCGHDETALNRVEQLIEDEILASAYELLDHYCEFVLTKLSYIRRHKDCPNDINEAVSSLIYASARCGDIPELCVIRKLFEDRYGDKFVITAMELLPGNLVNNQLKENLSGNPVSDDLKFKTIDEIVRENCTQEQVLAIQYYPSWQQEQDTQTCVDLSMSKPNDFCSSPKSTLIDVSAIVPDKETEIACYESDTDRHESSSEKSSIRAYKKSKRGSEVKRPRRRSASFESIGIMDIGYMVYYHKPCRSPSSYKPGTRLLRKDQKPSMDGISLSSYAQKRLKQHSFSGKEKISHSSQSEDDDDKQKKCIKATHIHQVLVDECGESKHHEAEYSVSVGKYGCSNTEGNHLRVMSMPCGEEKMVRTYSCPYTHPNHVHPKLPEYDDIAAKFTALKRECQESKVKQ